MTIMVLPCCVRRGSLRGGEGERSDENPHRRRGSKIGSTTTTTATAAAAARCRREIGVVPLVKSLVRQSVPSGETATTRWSLPWWRRGKQQPETTRTNDVGIRLVGRRKKRRENLISFLSTPLSSYLPLGARSAPWSTRSGRHRASC